MLGKVTAKEDWTGAGVCEGSFVSCIGVMRVCEGSFVGCFGVMRVIVLRSMDIGISFCTMGRIIGRVG